MRITVKVGTSTLAHATGRLNIQRMEGLCKVLSDLKNAGHEIILVSSGAIGMGVGKLNLPGRPKDMPTKQAAAAVGQCELMYTYDKLFNGENDTLSAIVAAAVQADLLILLSDIDGLYDGDPHRDPTAKLIPVVPSIDAHILALGGGSGSGLGTGGMATKLKAAQIVTEGGCQMVIANGSKPALLYDIVGGKPVGTRFLAKEK